MLGAVVLMFVPGCGGSTRAPVRFATTRGSAEPMVFLGALLYSFEAAPFRKVQDGIGRSIGRPTQFMTLQPVQIHTHLASGHVQFAFVDEGDEAEVTADGAGRVIARPLFKEGPPVRRALFVVAKDSSLESLADCKAKRVAFGSPNHPVKHWAALEALQAAGVSYQDLSKQVVPIPGSLQFHANSFEAAKAALFKIEADVGVVDEEIFQSWPDTGSGPIPAALSLGLSRDQFKVIGHTEEVLIFPSGSVVASKEADPELVLKVQRYLTHKLPRKKGIAEPLDLVEYVAATTEPEVAEHAK